MIKRYIYGLIISLVFSCVINTSYSHGITGGSGLISGPDFTSAGGISASANLTDNALIRGDGGAKAIQDSGILVDDSDNVTGATSIDIGGTSLFGSRSLTVDTGGGFDINMGIASGDDFTIDTTGFVYEGDTGNIGISTATPNAPLEVKGTIAGSVGGFESGILHVTNESVNEFSNSVITGHNSFNTNTQLWYIGSMSGSNDDIAFINRQNGDIQFYTNNTLKMHIDANGDVIIGSSINEITPTFSIVGDADSDAADVSETLSLTLIQNATPTNAVWQFDNTQALGYKFANGNVEVAGYTKLGSTAPSIKMKKLTGTTGVTEGDNSFIVHGLTQSKIIGFQVFVIPTDSIPPSFTAIAEFQYDAYIESTNVVIMLHATNSGNLLSKSITVLITYEE